MLRTLASGSKRHQFPRGYGDTLKLGRLSSRRSRASHHSYSVTKVFKFAQPAHTQCPISSRLTGVEAMDGFGVCTALPTSFSLWARPRATMHAAADLASDRRPTALLLGSLRLGLTLVAFDAAAKGADSGHDLAF